VKAIAVTPDGSVIATGSYDGTAIIWTRRDGAWSWRVLHHHDKPGVPAVAIANDNVFTAGWDGTVACWTLTGRLVTAYNVPAT
jgi:WD40 repeat protein